MDFTPTHRITFAPLKGDPVEYLVALCPQDPDGSDRHSCGPAYDEQEWHTSSEASWSLDNGEWRYCGQTTPGGANGTVEVFRL